MNKPVIDIRTERLHIKPLDASNKEDYMELEKETGLPEKLYEIMPEFKDIEFEQKINSEDNIYLSVFLNEGECYVASFELKDYKTDVIEFGCTVKKEYRNTGIATEIVTEVLKETNNLFPDAKEILKIDKDNRPSRKTGRSSYRHRRFCGVGFSCESK